MRKYIIYPLLGMFLVVAGCAAGGARYPDVSSVKKDTNHILVMPLAVDARKSEKANDNLDYERSLCNAASPALLEAIKQQGFITTTFTVRSKGVLGEKNQEQAQRDTCFFKSGKARRIAATYNAASNWPDPSFSRSQGIGVLQDLFMVTLNEHVDPQYTESLNKHCADKCYVAFPFLQEEKNNGERVLKFSLIVIEMSSPSGDLVSHVFGSKPLQGNDLAEDQRVAVQLITQTVSFKP